MIPINFYYYHYYINHLNNQTIKPSIKGRTDRSDIRIIKLCVYKLFITTTNYYCHYKSVRIERVKQVLMSTTIIDYAAVTQKN